MTKKVVSVLNMMDSTVKNYSDRDRALKEMIETAQSDVEKMIHEMIHDESRSVHIVAGKQEDANRIRLFENGEVVRDYFLTSYRFVNSSLENVI